MKEYKNVQSTVYPVKQMSKTKVRVPSNIKTKKILNEDGTKQTMYIYDEVIYEMNEFIKVNDEEIQENLDVAMMAIDYSYMESSELFDIVMMAIDSLYMEMTDLISKL